MTTDVIAIQRSFEDLQQQFLRVQQSRSKLIDLQHENELVLEDIKNLKPESKVYQTIGPTLLPRKHEDVKTALTEKLGFIKRQLDTANTQLQDLEKKLKDANKERLQISQANKQTR